MRGCFITGTDTGVGKTLVSVGLLHALHEHGLTAIGMKPIGSGAERGPSGLYNEDAVALRAASGTEVALADVNTYCFEEPVSPHIAAAAAATSISIQPILRAANRLSAAADLLVVEGVGGWRVPISATLTVADLVMALELPVVLVVGLRLGCINHALLTAEAISRDGAHLIGWVGNQVEPAYQRRAETLQTLAHYLPAPCLADVAFQRRPSAQAFKEQFQPALELFLQAIAG